MTELVSDRVSRFTHALPGIGAHCSIVQAMSGTFHRLRADQPALILVRRGEKRLVLDGRELRAGPGELVVMPRGLECTVINTIAGALPYQADAFVIAPELVASFSQPAGRSTREAVRIVPDPGLVEALERAGAHLARTREADAVTRHVVGELVIRLAALGIGLSTPRSEGMAESVRALVLTNPSDEWSSRRVSDALATSEATLRRKLAASGTSLTDIVADVRMTMAASLLQATEMPINLVALEVGYESASKFAARFRERFGFSPRDIRAPSAEDDRSGAENDRRRAAAE